jgi:SAM-dependent methyltransferase
MEDVLGQALMDYYQGHFTGRLWIHNQYGAKEAMPVPVYFRSPEAFTGIEKLALQLCRGKILDIGAAAGSHALWLQQNGKKITALDISPLAVAVMQARGLTSVVQQDIFRFSGSRFDTLLLLMNGIGLAGTIAGLRRLLQHSSRLLRKDGQLLFDSSDVAYVYEGKPLPEEKYYGEIHYRYGYKKQLTDWFSWLYIDKVTMTRIAQEEGWKMECLMEDENDQYLARLVRVK